MISRELEVEILRLYHAERWSIGTIAAQLRIHHSTVRRVLKQAGVLLPATAARLSMVDSYKGFIVQTLTQYPSLRSSRLYAMARERGYRGSADHFRHRVALLRPRPTAEAYLRLRTLPGEQAQCDWALCRARHSAHYAEFWTTPSIRSRVACLRLLTDCPRGQILGIVCSNLKRL